MTKQTFTVTLEVLTPFGEYFPTVTPIRLAEIVRNALQTGSSDFPVPLPFEVVAEGMWDKVSLPGQMQAAYPGDAFEEAEQASMWGE